MSFPIHRLRRLRARPTLRRMTRETLVTTDNLIAPLFVENGCALQEPIEALPGQFRFSPDTAAEEAATLWHLGIPAILLFGIPDAKEATGKSAYDDDGPVPNAIRRIKEVVPEMCILADVCACEYTDHGHCGILHETQNGVDVDNDQTLGVLRKAALCYARAGADIIAPSDMMDGRVAAIRSALDGEGFPHLPIFSYAAKFAGAFYGPFREAAGSSPGRGDRRGYQMDISNRREAMREMQLDIEEGADALIIKPALYCLDIVRDAREHFDLPLVAYNVSSEYAMIKAAGERGWIDEENLVDETLVSIKRAGADMIISYHAKEWAQRQ